MMKKAKKTINKRAKNLFLELVNTDNFIRERMNVNKRYGYCIYDKNMNPIKQVATFTFKKIEHLFDTVELSFLLSQSKILALHGNDYFKKTYKTLKDGTRCNELK